MTDRHVLKIWTNTAFEGHWPVGTAAVVVAETEWEAAQYLEPLLAERGLMQKVDPKGFVEMPFKRGTVALLRDGDY